MALWFVFAMMTAAAVFAVLLPLGRGLREAAGGTDAEVYKDQLDELSREANEGMIAPDEAEAARVEVARRLLAAADHPLPPGRVNRRARRGVAVAALAGLPLVALAIYLPLGAPLLPDQPLAARLTEPSSAEPLERLVAQVEAHLERNATDGRGWAVLAPVLLKLGRTEDAVRAYRNSITYLGETSERRADLGEALVAAANGIVTAEAKAEFDRAFALDASAVKPRYFLGLAAEQDGRRFAAATIWQALLADSPDNAPWRDGVLAALQRVHSVGAPALSDDAINAASGLGEGDRTVMIRGMVDRLATRLHSEGGGSEEWLRLIRAYMVLGERDNARATLRVARNALSAKANALQDFEAGVKALGLDG